MSRAYEHGRGMVSYKRFIEALEETRLRSSPRKRLDCRLRKIRGAGEEAETERLGPGTADQRRLASTERWPRSSSATGCP